MDRIGWCESRISRAEPTRRWARAALPAHAPTHTQQHRAKPVTRTKDTKVSHRCPLTIATIANETSFNFGLGFAYRFRLDDFDFRFFFQVQRFGRVSL